tara:strand:+ start:150 stop:764 length:615 start_codon:yes stop_codon:yes gene_type:complete
MKYKILQMAIIENLICFLDEIQEESLMDITLPENKEKVRFCQWAIKKLLDSKDAIITETEKPENEKKMIDRYGKIDDKFYDWKLPENMSEKEFDKMLDQFDAFLRGWEKEYNKKHPDKPTPKREQKFKPPHIEDIAEYMSLEEIQDYLLDDPELTDEERFELYYEERERVKRAKQKKKDARGALSYDAMLKKLKLLPPDEPKKK